MMKRKTQRLVIAHILGWVLFLGLVIAFVASSAMDEHPMLPFLFSWSFLFFLLFYVAVFYLNLQVLLPFFFVRKKYVAYGGILVALLVVTLYLQPFERLIHSQQQISQPEINRPEIDRPKIDIPRFIPPAGKGFSVPFGEPPKTSPFHFDLLSISLFLIVWAIGTLIIISRQWQNAEERNVRIKMDKAEAELSFLKAQISPHFLFNSLNNIYALAIKKSEHTATSIVRLSNIMRYITDEAREDFVPIEKEISCVNDFMALQKLRLGQNVQINYEVTGIDEEVRIAPLILMAFVENVFKHGLSKNIQSDITIKIHVSSNDIYLLTCNTRALNPVAKNRTGIGLENVKQRLELLYPDKYSLQLSEDDERFIVRLKIHFKGIKKEGIKKV